MSVDVEIILDKVESLSVSELLTVQEKITQKLRQKTNSDQTATVKSVQRRVNIPGSYQPTKEQIENRLSLIFTPEQLAEMQRVDLDDLPPGLKTVTEMLAEDREDRL